MHVLNEFNKKIILFLEENFLFFLNKRFIELNES